MSKNLGEIARRLYKPRWADLKEYRQAVRALSRLSDAERAEVERLGAQYTASQV